MFYSERFGPCLFKGFNLGPANIGGLGDNFGHRGVNFRFEAKVLSVQIYKGDFH